jgi:hypothetical protein
MTTRDSIRAALYAEQAQQRQELAARQAAEREAEGLDQTPIATWNAFSPDQLADIITGVTRCEGALAAEVVRRVTEGRTHEFGTQRRDPFGGQLIGGARWLAERDASAFVGWRLHLLETEPEGAA